MNRKMYAALLACLGVILLSVIIFANKECLYKTDYYIVKNPDNWEFYEVNDLITIVYFNGEEIGSIVVYPKSPYAHSISSIVSNIYGMHAYLIEEAVSEKKGDDLVYCIVVGYEASAAGINSDEFSLKCPETGKILLAFGENCAIICA